MTTLRKEAFLIKDELAGGNSSIDDQLDVRDIIMQYKAEMSNLLQLMFYDNMSLGDKSVIPVYVAFYPDIEVKLDTQDDCRYIDLPSSYMQLPHNKGIVKMNPSKTPEVQIYKSNNPYVAKDLPGVANFEGSPWGWPEGTKFKFAQNNWNVDAWQKVNVKLLIPGPDSLGENDTLPIIPNQVSEIRRRVKEYFSREVIQDVLNDGNKDRGVNTRA